MGIPVRAIDDGYYDDSLRSRGNVFLLQDKKIIKRKKNSNAVDREKDGTVKYTVVTAKMQFSHQWMEEIDMALYRKERGNEDEIVDEAPIDDVDVGAGSGSDEGVSAEHIKDVLNSLDTENDAHWTSKGLPAMEAVEELGGFEADDISRKDVTNANPTFSRDIARAERVNG